MKNTQPQFELSEAQHHSYNDGLKAGRNAAAQVLGATHHGLDDVKSHLSKKLLSEFRRGRAPNRAFACVVARREAYKVLKREQRHDNFDAALSGAVPTQRLKQMPAQSPAQELELKELNAGIDELAKALKPALKALGHERRQFLVGFVLRHNFKAKAFAVELNTTPGNVTVHYHRLRDDLLVALQKAVSDSPLGLSALNYLTNHCCLPACKLVRGLLRRFFEFSGSVD